jgi:hypothetical protein
MAGKMQKRTTRDMEIKFGGKIEFEGSVSEFKAVMAGLGKLSAQGLKIGSSPPDHPGATMMIDTVPLPERDIAGIISVVRYLSTDMLNRVTEGMYRFRLIKDIRGGIRTAHLHLQDEVVLLEEARFKEVVQHVAAELAGELADIAEYPETVGAIRHLTPGMR